jgi:hypothetical protein
MANSDSSVTRRVTLQIIGVGGLSATGLLPLAGCGGEEEGGGGGEVEGEAAGQGCDAPIDAQSQQMRTNLQYVEQTQQEGKMCSNCAQYVADEYGDCGGCNVFDGPVQPNGHCLSWAAQAAEAPAEEPAAPAEEPAGEAPAEEPAATEEG